MSATPKETEWQRRQRRNDMRMAHAVRTGGTCDVCGARPGDVGLCGAKLVRALDEDHDHKTGVHRGFICWRSNRALPSYANPKWLRLLADYLEARS